MLYNFAKINRDSSTKQKKYTIFKHKKAGVRNLIELPTLEKTNSYQPMTNNKLHLLLALTTILFITGCQKKTEKLIQFVVPRIGTGPSTGTESIRQNQNSKTWGLTIPAVSTPFGMTQWTPQTRDGEKKGISPYYYGGMQIQGFRGSHWSESAQKQDYGSFTIMPITDYLRTFPAERASEFTHENETSSPAYYSCMLLNYMTFVELTGTAHSGFFKFSFAEGKQAFILITPNSDNGQGYIKVDTVKQEIYGYNPVNGISQDAFHDAGFKGYFVVRFNKAFDNYGCYYQMENHKKEIELSAKSDIGAYASFKIKLKDVILAKAGTSFTSIEAARANLDAEIPNWDFEKTKTETEKVWNESLSAIHLKGGKAEDYTKFYTALYRSLLFPRTFSDVDGSYPAFDGGKPNRKVEQGHVYYDDFSLNNRRKAQLSLVSLIAPEQYEDILKSAKLKKEQGGWNADTILTDISVPYHYNNSDGAIERQSKVKSILKNDYTCFDGGIPGNDNSGLKSAWYVFSAMGFYPSSTKSSDYQLSSPIYKEVELNLNPKFYPGGKFRISLDDADTYKTFNKAELNGKEVPFVLKQKDLQEGGKLKFSNTGK
jgi:putative alpha-1,2-mannosidase